MKINKWEKIKTPQWAAISSVFIVAVFMLVVLNTHEWDPRSFILDAPDDLPEGQYWGVGYDAQFYYQIAEDPFGAYTEMDLFVHRYQRIFFPFLIRIFSLGNPNVLPWVMLLTNLGAVYIGTNALAALVQKRGGNPYIAIIWILSIGYLFSLRLDLLEPLALGLALWGWKEWERERIFLGILFFMLAGLTKELGLIIPIGLAAWELINRKYRKGIIILVGSLGPYLGWFSILRVIRDQVGMPANGFIQPKLPFTGFFANQDTASRILMLVWVVLPFLIAGVLAAWDGFRFNWQSKQGLDALVVIFHIGFMSVLPAATWFDPIALFRTSLGGVAVILLFLAAYHPRLIPAAMGVWLPSSLIFFIIPGLLLP